MLKVAVVTPYHRESEEWLRQCHESVLRQSHPCTHILVADGHPQPVFAGNPGLLHVTLPRENADYGNTPRAIGGLLAEAYGFDAVAYLDADNWYEPEHIAVMAETLAAYPEIPLITCRRSFHALDGSPLALEEPEEADGRFVDTNCWLILRPAFALLRNWLMPKRLAVVGDRIFLQQATRQRYGRVSLSNRSVAYRTGFASHYERAGVPPPPGAKADIFTQEWLDWLHSVEGVEEITAALGFYPRLLG